MWFEGFQAELPSFRIPGIHFWRWKNVKRNETHPDIFQVQRRHCVVVSYVFIMFHTGWCHRSESLTWFINPKLLGLWYLEYIYWLVVSNMTFIFHFIYGMSSFPLTNSMVFREHSPWRFLADAACHNGKNTPLLILHYNALCFIMLFYVFIEYLCIIICI